MARSSQASRICWSLLVLVAGAALALISNAALLKFSYFSAAVSPSWDLIGETEDGFKRYQSQFQPPIWLEVRGVQLFRIGRVTSYAEGESLSFLFGEQDSGGCCSDDVVARLERVIDSGFPFRSFRHHRVRVVYGDGSFSEYTRGALVLDAGRSWLLPAWMRIELPYGVGPGLWRVIVNILVWSLVVLLVIYNARDRRQRKKARQQDAARRAGNCAKCRYPLGTLSRCPECGDGQEGTPDSLLASPRACGGGGPPQAERRGSS